MDGLGFYSHRRMMNGHNPMTNGRLPDGRGQIALFDIALPMFVILRLPRVVETGFLSASHR